MARPTTMPRWANSPTTLRTEPSETLKDSGHSPNERLPAQFYNWLVGFLCDWVNYFDGYIYEGSVSHPVRYSGGLNVDWTDASNYIYTSTGGAQYQVGVQVPVGVALTTVTARVQAAGASYGVIMAAYVIRDGSTVSSCSAQDYGSSITTITATFSSPVTVQANDTVLLNFSTNASSGGTRYVYGATVNYNRP